MLFVFLCTHFESWNLCCTRILNKALSYRLSTINTSCSPYTCIDSLNSTNANFLQDTGFWNVTPHSLVNWYYETPRGHFLEVGVFKKIAFITLSSLVGKLSIKETNLHRYRRENLKCHMHLLAPRSNFGSVVARSV
jgi:hypothetical protein